MMQKINYHYLIRAWAKYAKENGGCIQCQHPWYDGLCDCEFYKENTKLVYEIEGLASKLVKSKNWSFN